MNDLLGAKRVGRLTEAAKATAHAAAGSADGGAVHVSHVSVIEDDVAATAADASASAAASADAGTAAATATGPPPPPPGVCSLFASARHARISGACMYVWGAVSLSYYALRHDNNGTTTTTTTTTTSNNNNTTLFSSQLQLSFDVR